jgi:hypothetical protein
MRILSLAFCLVAALVFPVSANGSVVPPGNSAADQYAETLPGAGGNQAGGTGGGGTGGGRTGAGSPQGDVNAATQRRLDELGPAGRAAAALAKRTAPAPVAKGADKRGRADTSPGSPGLLTALKQAASSGQSGGMGIVLPLVLTGSVLAGFALLWSRRRGVEAAGSSEGANSSNS